MKTERFLNGYRLLYRPDWPTSMTSNNWKGWIYEHRLVAESRLGRSLLANEIVHHIDENRANNDPSNLEVLTRKQHIQHHTGIKASICCANCGTDTKNKKYCSNVCRTVSLRRVTRPDKATLNALVTQYNFVRVGKMFGVSDNAIRKWLK